MSTATNAVCLITVLTAPLSVHFEKFWCSLRAFALVFSIVFYNRITATCIPSQERQLVLMESMNKRLDSFLASQKKQEEENATLQQENVKLRTEHSKQERLIQSRSSYGFKGRFTYLFYCFDVRRKAFHRERSEFVLIL